MVMALLTPELREKIERRANRAFRYFDKGLVGTKGHVTRVSDVTADALRYRLPHKAGKGYYSGPKLTVERKPDGTVMIVEPPAPPMIDLLVQADLAKLADHTGRVRAYKVTKSDGSNPHQNFGRLDYAVGKTVEILNANTDKGAACGTGIHLGTLEYCKREYKGNKDYRIFAVEFDVQGDLAVVPTSTDGKFRVFRCHVVEELSRTQIGM